MASTLEPKINRIATAVTRALSALTAKGVTVPEGANVESLAALIGSIEAGGGGGGAVYTFGTFSLSSDTAAEGYVIEHGLGVIPQIFILFQKYHPSGDYYLAGFTLWSEGIRQAGYPATKYAISFHNNGVGMYTRGGIINKTSVTIDESSITLPDLSSAIMKSGLTNQWIAIGGISV